MNKFLLRRFRGVLTILVLVMSTNSQAGNPEPDKYGPPDIVSRGFGAVDLPALIDPQVGSTLTVSDDDFIKAFDAALQGFSVSQVTPEAAREKRNRVQDRLILSSNDLCEEYKSVLKRKQARFNFLSGTAATLFGAAGSLLPHAATAKLFAGLSAVATGTRAEYNHDYYADVAAHLISKAITKRRRDMLTEIETRRSKGIQDYSLERAIADVINYHGACSLVGGLEEADNAVATLNVFTGQDAASKAIKNIVSGRGGE